MRHVAAVAVVLSPWLQKRGQRNSFFVVVAVVVGEVADSFPFAAAAFVAVGKEVDIAVDSEVAGAAMGIADLRALNKADSESTGGPVRALKKAG